MRTPYTNGCEYTCEFHFGKPEQHHPVSWAPLAGIINLCEAHHSILQGRKHKYHAEMTIDKTLVEMKREIMGMIAVRLEKVGLTTKDIDKK